MNVFDQLPGEASGDVGAATQHDLGMLLEEPLAAVPTGEAASYPQQRRGATLRRQVVDLHPSSVMHLVGHEPTKPTASNPAGIADLHDQPLNQVDHDG